MTKIILKICLSLIIITAGYFVWPKILLASSNGLVIDEFRTRSESLINDEYIVLANYGNVEINLENYSLVRKTSTGSNSNLISKFPKIAIPSQGKMVIAHKEHSGTKDLVYSSSALADSNNAILLFDSIGTIIDSATYGNLEYVGQEGTALDNPSAGVPYKRINGQDTNNNYLDFVADIVVEPIDVNADKLLLTELMPDPESGDEWFEIYNPTNLAVSLKNLKICDLYGRTHCYYFSDEAIIQPKQYLTVDQSVSRITMNNDGDILEIRDTGENVFTSSGESYGDTENGMSYSLFNSGWAWTTTATKGTANVFVDIMEVEPITKTTKKATSKKPKTTAIKASTESESTEPVAEEVIPTEVKGTEANTQPSDQVISRKNFGIFLIVLAFITLLGYTIWDKRAKIDEIYKRISRRNN
jgi:hypothetical protein